MNPSLLLTTLMTALPVLVAILFVAAVWRGTRSTSTTLLAAAGVASLMALQYGLAATGVLREWDRRPPAFMLLIAATIGITLWCALSKLGGKIVEHTGLAVLIGVQAFRLPLELTMNRAATEGVMPVQMSYSGYNFDILTGASAVLLAVLLRANIATRSHIRLWNAIGFCLLVNIVGIAVLSLPVFAAFGPSQLNTWVAYPPFIWLPGVLVPAALMGHVLIWRKLFTH